MKVQALRAGFDGLQRRKEGEIFDWPSDRKLGSWVEAIDDDKEAKAANKEAEKERLRAEHAKIQREAIGHIVEKPEQGDGK